MKQANNSQIRKIRWYHRLFLPFLPTKTIRFHDFHGIVTLKVKQIGNNLFIKNASFTYEEPINYN